MTVLAADPGAKVPAPAPEWGGQFLYPGLYLIGALLIGAAVIALAGRWRQRSGRDSASANDQLALFRSMFHRGEISREEFDRLRSHLGGQLLSPRETTAIPQGTAPGGTEAIRPGPPPVKGRASPPPPDGIRPA